jgi:hypothetical protein
VILHYIGEATGLNLGPETDIPASFFFFFPESSLTQSKCQAVLMRGEELSTYNWGWVVWKRALDPNLLHTFLSFSVEIR